MKITYGELAITVKRATFEATREAFRGYSATRRAFFLADMEDGLNKWLHLAERGVLPQTRDRKNMIRESLTIWAAIKQLDEAAAVRRRLNEAAANREE